jgi:photosystem II stability/assembly factor-like uncharacterized protein
MTYIWIFISFYILSFNLLANITIPAVPSPLASQSLLLDIEVIDQNKLVAVGEHGHILLSIDGQTWQQADVPVQTTLTAVFFINANKGWAVGHDATILSTINGGNHWYVQQYLPELQKPLLDVAFKDENHGLAVGAFGLFYRTHDGGITWQSEYHQELLSPEDIDYLNELKLQDEEDYLDQRSGLLPHFNRLTIDGVTLYLTGEMGLIAKSHDFGQHWQKFNEIYQGSFFDIARTQKGNLLVAGLRGHIFRSLKNGTPWQVSASNTTVLLNSIVLAEDQRLFILGNNGVLLESIDDGQTFIKHRQPDGKSLIDGVWFHGNLITVSDVGIKQIRLFE